MLIQTLFDNSNIYMMTYLHRRIWGKCECSMKRVTLVWFFTVIFSQERKTSQKYCNTKSIRQRRKRREILSKFSFAVWLFLHFQKVLLSGVSYNRIILEFFVSRESWQIFQFILILGSSKQLILFACIYFYSVIEICTLPLRAYLQNHYSKKIFRFFQVVTTVANER